MLHKSVVCTQIQFYHIVYEGQDSRISISLYSDSKDVLPILSAVFDSLHQG